MNKIVTLFLALSMLLFSNSLKAQVGIGTNTPLARLHVADSNVIFSELGDIPATPPGLPVLAAGRYFLWHPGRSAVRMGYFAAADLTAAGIGRYSFASGNRTIAYGVNSIAMGDGSQALERNATAMGTLTKAIGVFSTAMGQQTEAGGESSTAMGILSRAMGNFATAMGYNTIAAGQYSTAMGRLTVAIGNSSTAMGIETEASGGSSTAMGALTKATGVHSTAMGRSTEASGFSSTAMGYETEASGQSSTAMGDSTQATGYASTALGISTTAQSYASVALGSFNLIAGSPTSWVYSDPVLVVGNGTGDGDRRNAFTLLKNGNLTIAGTLTQNSDARLKTNILPLSMALSKVLTLNGYQYNWNTHYADNEEMHTGLLAQEVQKLMPELVREDAGGTLSVNYTGMVPYLIESVKAQQQEIEKQNDAIETLKKEIETLKTLIHAEKK